MEYMIAHIYIYVCVCMYVCMYVCMRVGTLMYEGCRYVHIKINSYIHCCGLYLLMGALILTPRIHTECIYEREVGK